MKERLKAGSIKRIVCLTEESVETLYSLGLGHLIVGVSIYVKRPKAAMELPKVCTFKKVYAKKVAKLRPDLIIGFSDIQKEIAKELIGLGYNVLVTNQRSLREILEVILLTGRLVGAEKEAFSFLEKIEQELNEIRRSASKITPRPKIFFEEWDDPLICGIKWVSELIELCGGVDIAKKYSTQAMAQGRIVPEDFVVKENPDFILACWCGKKVRSKKIKSRENWYQIKAIQEGRIIEVPPEIYLQPGPALLLSGARKMLELFQEWSLKEKSKEDHSQYTLH